jgi:hypothetical protein
MHKDHGRILSVDVGGEKGHVVQDVRQENAWLCREKGVVQDRRDVADEGGIRANEESINKVLRTFTACDSEGYKRWVALPLFMFGAVKFQTSQLSIYPRASITDSLTLETILSMSCFVLV